MMMIRMLAFHLANPQNLEASPKKAQPPQQASKKNGVSAKKAVTESWREMIEHMQLTGLIAELARHCVLESQDQQHIRLLLKKAQQNLLTPERQRRLEASIHEYFGDDLKLTVTIGESDQPTPNQQKQKERATQQQAAIKAVQKDENVQSILREFDGEIDTGSITPLLPYYKILYRPSKKLNVKDIDMKDGMNKILKQAQKMQEKMQQAQTSIENTEITGESGGGLVKVTMTGRHDAKRVEIADELLNDDREMLEDLIAAAINDAVRLIEQTNAKKMADITGGIDLPPGIKLPF